MKDIKVKDIKEMAIKEMKNLLTKDFKNKKSAVAGTTTENNITNSLEWCCSYL